MFVAKRKEKKEIPNWEEKKRRRTEWHI